MEALFIVIGSFLVVAGWKVVYENRAARLERERKAYVAFKEQQEAAARERMRRNGGVYIPTTASEAKKHKDFKFGHTYGVDWPSKQKLAASPGNKAATQQRINAVLGILKLHRGAPVSRFYLAHRMNCSESQVKYAIHQLIKKGFIRVGQRKKTGVIYVVKTNRKAV